MTLFQRSALILLAATALSACATPQYPTVASAPAPTPAPAPQLPPPPPPPPPEVDAPVAPAPSAPLEVRPLDRPPPAAAPPALPPVVQAPPAAPVYRTVTTRQVTGRVLDVAGPARTYRVKSGDNLQRIADQLDTTVEQLAEDNDLKQPYVIHPGDTLKGPQTRAKAYVVGQGDTLSSISRRFGVSVEALRETNDLSRNASIGSGRRLRLPSGFRDRGPIVTTSRVLVEGGREVADAPPSRPTTVAQADEEAEERPTTSRQVTGRVVDMDGPARSYRVRSGDNLERIAERLDTSVEQLAKDNKLRRPYVIRPGQNLKGPVTEAKGYVVGQGDTLALIGRRFAVSAEALRSQNGLSRNASLSPGRRLRLPAGYRDRGPIVATTQAAVAPSSPQRQPEPPPPALPRAPIPYAASGGTPTPRPTPSTPAFASRPNLSPGGVPGGPVASPRPGDTQIASLGQGRFIWPILGEVISDFGVKGAGQRNDGIDIRAAAGDPIRASAAGEVVYAGDQVPGFGNLVLIKHDAGWTTAYAHLSRVDVKIQQRVTQGQQIGQAGATGGVPDPRLHFEVRYVPTPDDRPQPVNPSLVLPR